MSVMLFWRLQTLLFWLLFLGFKTTFDGYSIATILYVTWAIIKVLISLDFLILN